ncbi:hypothetical protein ACQKL5_08395 [Peribacillus sp. NPDC097675]|uniref:hypothetical protein n=1 Tax=Peribacillus sp. NPDC097675 TaxID=3390618 RepID=UPI003CFEE149
MNWFDFMTFAGLLFYLIPIVFIAWFLISFIKTQKERNSLLREISLKLDKNKIEEKEE